MEHSAQDKGREGRWSEFHGTWRSQKISESCVVSFLFLFPACNMQRC